MERMEFIEAINEIMWQEGYQCQKAKVIKSSVNSQRTAINKIAKELNIKPLTYDEVLLLSFD